MKRPKTGGLKKGFKFPKTLEKEQAREYIRQTVIASLAPMLEAQIANAQGIKYLVSRDKATGKFTRLTAEQAEMLGTVEQDDSKAIEVWEKDPNVTAFADVLNRALGKPTESLEVEMTVNNALDERLKTARGRVGKRA